MDKKELVKQLDEGFKVLTYYEKIVLQLFYYEELNYSEISEIIEKDIGEVGLLLCTAKTKMKSFTDIFEKIDNIQNNALKLFSSGE